MKRLASITLVLTICAWLMSACAAQQGTAALPWRKHKPAAQATVAAQAPVKAQVTAEDEAVPAAAPLAAAAEPATQPAPQASGQALPKGHPDISSMMQQQGNPAPAAAPGGALPSGHPDISAMLAARNKKAATQPAGATGTLAVTARQGTAGGPPVGADDIHITVYDNGNEISKIDGKLDESGKVIVKGLPVGPAIQPVIKITHAGVEYEATGPVVDGSEQALAVPVYETTETEPAWQVRMRHVITRPTTEGVQVMEMLSVENPADRAWIGAAGPDGSRKTFSIDLPAGSEQVQLMGGFHDCCVKVEGSRITNSMALLPGNTQYQLAYVVPVKDGKATLSAVAPAPVSNLMIFVPEDGSTVVPEGLEAGTASMGTGNTRYYKAAAMQAGQQVKLVISNIKLSAAEAAAADESTGGAAAGPAAPAPAMNTADLAKAIAGVGALVIFLFGGAALLMRPGGKANAATK